ncbi:hypothetical protein MATL_G00072830 [Megalops atlanticus]|uniref:Macrophage colony-stimulating factor 1 n=1 Tax=Megalops atlanticus TaxID=7932 RepID=A0A9D3QA51_MEGAT|nr:hypothetical protein MATL_G00072830 [Megalops atlanticus]
MNTHKQTIFYKAKAGRQCFFLILCFHLALGEVPGPCRHSVTKDHLQKIKRLIENQLQNGCSVTYTFTERQSLSKVCYVKAAFPQVLELLNTRFQYAQSSDNYHYVFALKNLVLNIYSQKCIPEINEELEDNPVRFMKEYSGSLREALEKIREVIQLYMELMTENNKPVDWNCEEEYAEDYPESTTTIAQTTDLLSPVPKQASVPVRTTDDKVVSPANRMDSDSSSEHPVEDSGKDFQNGTWGGSLISYKTAFIVACVCGGLLLIINLYCFKEQRKLKAFLHSSRIRETERLTSNGTDIEMQLYETKQSGLASS